MLLNAQLLELDKFGPSGLQVESTSRFVGNTLLAGAHDERHEGGRLDLWDTNTSSGITDHGSFPRHLYWTRRSYRLIRLGATLVTRVSSHCHHGLDLSGAGHYSTDAHQFPDGVGFDITHHFGFRGGGRFEVELTENNTKS